MLSTCEQNTNFHIDLGYYRQCEEQYFNNISVISWQSVLLMEETGVPGENDQLYHIMLYRVHFPRKGLKFTILVMIGTVNPTKTRSRP